MSKPPKITLGFISWNRLHYLRATLESARACIQYPNLEWIVIDNESDEPGLREYLDGCSWLDRVVYRRQTHAAAMNQLVELAAGELLLVWPEDVQFTLRGEWMREIAQIMLAEESIGSMCLDYMRRSTIRDVFQPDPRRHWRQWLQELRRYGPRFRRSHVLRSANGYPVRTFGWRKPGVCGSGIPSLTRTEVWRRLGPWVAARPNDASLVDSSLGAEEDMVLRFFGTRWPLQGAIPLVPVAADIITDPTGCKAKVRGRYRYGVYMPPPEGTFYYRIRDEHELTLPDDGLPIDFTRAVEPLGFRIPLDANGDRRKFAFNDSVVHDARTGERVDYPLTIETKR